jgi:hypothetical protein
VNGSWRQNFAEVDKALGGELPYDPAPSSSVTSILYSGSHVYVGGYFSMFAGQQRNGLAKFDAANATLSSYDPAPSGSINSMILYGGKLYLGGSFSTLNGISARNLGAIAP